MSGEFRGRVGRAAQFGLLAMVVVVLVQWFVGIPVGDQPGWLGVVALAAAVPAAYVTVPVSEPLERLIGMELGSGRIIEVATPFGPAMRGGIEDVALIGFGTLLMVGLAAYLAIGVNEMVTDY